MGNKGKQAGVVALAVVGLVGLAGPPATADPAPDLSGDTIMLPNLDDDSRRCRVTAADLDAVGGEVDARLAAYHDAADEVVNGRDDEKDFSLLEARRMMRIGSHATGRITVDRPAYARVFVKRGAGWQVASTLSAAELRRGVQLAVEGRDIVRDRKRWNGKVTVTLTVTDGATKSSDDHELRVAPLLLQHDLQRATSMIAGAPGNGPGQPNGMGLHPPRDWDRFSADLNRAAARTGTQTTYLMGSNGWWHDVWWQDLFEPATASMPTRHGTQTIRFAIRSGNIWPVPAADGTVVRTPRPAGRMLFRDVRGPDIAVVQELADDGRDVLVDLRNATGNIESLPPYRGYPQGRLVYGSALDGSPAPRLKPDPAFIELLTSQGQQPPIVIDTSWLFVGHADETIHVVRANNGRGWTLLVADPRLAARHLRDAQAQGAGDARLFAGTDSEWQPSVSELLADPTFLADNETAAGHIDDQVEIMLRETGLRPADLIRVPVLFGRSPRISGFVAVSPGIPNGLSLDPHTFAAPDPHGPIANGRDIFRGATERALRGTGVRVQWVEELNWAHFGGGEVHCTTNAWRDTSGTRPWWRH